MFLQIIATTNSSMQNEVLMILTQGCSVEKYRPGMTGETLRSGDTRLDGNTLYRHGMTEDGAQA